MILTIVSAPGMVGAFQVKPEFRQLMECRPRPTIEEPGENQSFLNEVPALIQVGASVSCQVNDYSKYFFEINTEYLHQSAGQAPVWKVFHAGSRIPFSPRGDLTVSFLAFKQLEFIYYGQWRLRTRVGYQPGTGAAIRGAYGDWRYVEVGSLSDLPDLVVDGMEVIKVPAGQQTIDGQSYPETRTYAVFTIRNKGKKIAPPTRVDIYCHSYMANDPCPQFPKTDIPQLWPKPDEISGAYKIWNSPAAIIREDSMMGFRVTVDPDNLIQESNEENNIRTYTMEQARNRARLEKAVHADQVKKIVQPPTTNLGKGVPTAPGSADSRKMGTALLPGQGSAPAIPAAQPAVSSLVIQSLSIAPLKPQAGVPFELSAQGLNSGGTPLQANHPLYLNCRVIQGGPNCPVPTGPIPLKTAIPAQGLHRLNLGSFAAQPGVYEVTLSSGPETRKNIKTLTLVVEAGLVPQKAPAVVTPHSPPAAGQAQSPSLSPAMNRPLKR